MTFAGYFIFAMLGFATAPMLTGICVSLAALYWLAAILNSVFRFTSK